MAKRILVLAWLLLLGAFACLHAQNAVVGSGFSTGWGGGACPTGAGDFSYLNVGAGSSFIATQSPNGTGNQFFRFGVDWSGTTSQLTITPGVDVAVTSSTPYSLNTNCTTSGAMYMNVASTAYNYVFKTQNAGTNPTGNFVIFEVQGTVRTVGSVTQLPIAGAVTPGAAVTITANLSGALSVGQDVYLRYSTNSFSTSTVVKMTGSGTTYSGTIPAGVNTANANVSYYVFTSGPTNVSADGSNADLFTINLNNNGGSNYNYIVLGPAATLYQHSFGTTTISAHPYTVAADQSSYALTASSWTNSNAAWTSFTGSGGSGQAIAINNSGGTPTITLSLNVQSGYAVNITDFDFWRQRSTSGAQNWSMTINGIAVGSGTVPTTGLTLGSTPVSNSVMGLTGTVTVVLSLSGASGTGTFRLDDFTLTGHVVPLSGSPSIGSDIIDNTNYGTGSPEFNSNPSYINFVDGSATTSGKMIPFKFRIRDGGAGLNDADALPTTLTAITFNVKNTSGTDRGNFIKQAILTTSAGTVIGTASSFTGSQIIFTGLSHSEFSVADNTQTASNIHLRVSYNEVNVVDNEKLVFSVANVTANSGGSQFGLVNAGAASTDNSTSNDRNRIEVIATALSFTQQPTDIGQGLTMTPSPILRAIDLYTKIDLDFGGNIELTSSGSMTGEPITLQASAGEVSFPSVVHTALLSGGILTANSTGLTMANSSVFDVIASVGATHFYRTATGFTTGNWNSTSSWESSPDNTTWSAATMAPNSSASGISIRSGILTISQNESAKLLSVESGAVLIHPSTWSFSIADDGTAAADFSVLGRYEINGTQPTFFTGATASISSGAEVRANTNNAPGESDNFARNTNVLWQNNAVFNWNTNAAFEASGETYFPNTPVTDIPTFRINGSPSVGANNFTTINGLLEIMTGQNVIWDNTGLKTFRNGIIGLGNITQAVNCGQLIINGATSQIGGTGTITLNTAGLSISAGTCTLSSDKTFNATSGLGTVSVANGATLLTQTFTIAGTGTFTLNAGGTLGIGSDNGITTAPTASGNIQTTTRNFNTAGNYTYNGTVNQVTGVGLPSTVTGVVSIDNTNRVTLTTNNTTVSTLNLNAGEFVAGLGQNVQIANGGTINGNGGNQPNDAVSGTITFMGTGVTNGTLATGSPRLYSVILRGGVDFNGSVDNNSARILNTLQLDAGGFCDQDAPFYEPGSTLIYNTGGAFNRNEEWGQPSALAQGYPHHVVVQNNTTLNLGSNTPASLEIGGNLNIGNSSSRGIVDMNATTVDLIIQGNLTIGTSTSTTSELRLSTSFGGDLMLYGDFTRWENNFYNESGRAIFFRGNNSSNIHYFPAPSATPGAYPTHQNFGYAFVEKTGGGGINLQTNVGISTSLQLTSGIIYTTENDMLVILSTDPAAVNGGSINSFINGPMIRRTSIATPGTYEYPIGKLAVSKFRPLRFSTMSNLSSGNEFKAEFFSSNNATPDPTNSNDNIFLTTLQGIQKDDYWQFDRTTAGSSSGKVALYYENPGNGYWRDNTGALIDPCATCNVAVVKRTATSGLGSWEFTKTDFNFDIYSPVPEAFLYSSNGFITSGEINSFSPFTIGFGYNNILGSLPVKLLSFDGKLQNGDAHLQWTIDSDKDLLTFEVQHSTNGVQFAKVGALKPAGNHYSFIHSKRSAGKHFYRLLVKEKAGNYHSKTIALVVGSGGTFITGLQTTVVQQQVVANVYSASNQKAEAIITDVSGKLIMKQSSQLLQGQNQFNVPVALLAKGLYHITLVTADGVRETFRWMKE